MKTRRTRRVSAAVGSVATILVLALAAGFVTAPDTASAAQYADGFESKLVAAEVVTKIAAGDESPTGLAAAAQTRSATAIRTAATVTRTSTATVTRTAAPAASPTAPAASAPVAAPSSADAQSILNRYIAKYPVLQGATVTYGDAKGYQAICYYKSGRIVISAAHTRSLETIIAHEVGHILDWRDNGVIDWGENIPAL